MVRDVWNSGETLRHGVETRTFGETAIINVVNRQTGSSRKIHELVPYRSMLQRFTESIERRDAVGHFRRSAGTGHYLVQVIQHGISRKDIEITGQDHRIFLGIDTVNALHNELQTVLFSQSALELLSGLAHFQKGPCGSAATCGIPAERRNLRSLRKPERTPILQFDSLGIEENHHHFTG